MAYSHYGKQAEVWKHLPLCDIIAHEQPSVYIETNSAYAAYTLCGSAEQEYGIYHFLRNREAHEVSKSRYYQLEKKAMQSNQYIGSPGLAMSILKEASRYIFFDIDREALQSIESFAASRQLSDKIECRHQDSIKGLSELLPKLPASTLIHIDPYRIDEPGENGYTYLDLFCQATGHGLKCFLWYGYQTLSEKEALEKLIQSSLTEKERYSLSCHELTLRSIVQNDPDCTPGVLGSGLLTSNLSKQSIATIAVYSKLLVELYREATYREFDGELYMDIVI